MNSCALNFAMQNLKVQRVSTTGEQGCSVPLVLLHGWGSDSKIWQPLLDCLNMDAELWLVDLPGFGANAQLPFTHGDQVLSQLKQSLPAKSILLGWSLGGMLATQFAARYSDRVEALVTIASNVQFVASDTWPTAMPEKEFTQFVAQFSTASKKTWQRFCALQAQGDKRQRYVLKTLRQQTVVEGCAKSWQQALQCLAQLNNRDALKALNIPGLHIFGAQDALVPSTAANKIAALNLTDQQTLVLENTGHAPHISQAEVLAQALRGFVNKQLVSKDLVALDKDYNLEKSRVARSFSKAAATYDQAASLQRKVGSHLLALLQETCDAGDIIDLGCGTGVFARQLAQAGYSVLAVDIAQGMLDYAKQHSNNALPIQWLCADAEAMTLVPNSVDGIFSNLALQWCGQVSAALRTFHLALKPGAYLCFTTFGPKTLWQLREAWQQVDGYVHVNRFETQAALSQYLLDAGLEQVQFTAHTENIPYLKLWHLLQELRALGAHNINAGCNKGLTGRQRLNQLEQAYKAFYSLEQQAFMASYEIFTAVARKPIL